MKPVTLTGIALILLAIILGSGSWLFFAGATTRVEIPAPKQQVVSTTGKEPEMGGVCAYDNGWNICPIRGAEIPGFWRRYKAVTGAPIGPFNANTSCQPFRNTKICVSTETKPGYEVEINNTGLDQLERDRRQGNSRSQAVTAVKDWIAGLERGGVDTNRAVGRIVTGEICEAEPSTRCIQYADKVVVEYPRGSTFGDDVKIIPK